MGRETGEANREITIVLSYNHNIFIHTVIPASKLVNLEIRSFVKVYITEVHSKL